MPIIKSAKKALRRSEIKRQFNLKTKNRMRLAVKTFNELTKEFERSTEKISADSLKNTQETLSKAYQAIDKAVKRGIIKKNTASRKKSHLAKKLPVLKKNK